MWFKIQLLHVLLIKFFVPGDFSGESKAVKFQPGEQEKTFPVVALHDNTPEVSATLAKSFYFTFVETTHLLAALHLLLGTASSIFYELQYRSKLSYQSRLVSRETRVASLDTSSISFSTEFTIDKLAIELHKFSLLCDKGVVLYQQR